MIDQWLPGAVITAINLLIMFGTMRYAERAYRWHHNAQQATCRATAAAGRAERAAGMQPPPGFGKAAAMDVMFGGGGFVIMNDEAAPFGQPMSTTVTFEDSDPEVIGMMFGIEVTELAPDRFAAGSYEVQLTEDGRPKSITRRRDHQEHVHIALQPYLADLVQRGEIKHDGQGPPICEPCSAECPACLALRGGS